MKIRSLQEQNRSEFSLIPLPLRHQKRSMERFNIFTASPAVQQLGRGW